MSHPVLITHQMNNVIPQVTQQKVIPHASIITKNFNAYDYSDTYSIAASQSLSVDESITKIFAVPTFVSTLLKLRDSLAVMFNHKATTSKTTVLPFYEIGSKAVFFTVIDRNEHEIVLEEKDKHLDFRTSVFHSTENGRKYIYLTTLVKYNNTAGRIYFCIVKPFHTMLVKIMLKNYLKSHGQ